MNPPNPFSLDGKVAVVTGGYGVLGGSIASGLAAAGARVAILGRRRDVGRAKRWTSSHRPECEARALIADVLDEQQLAAARDELLRDWGRIDILVNAAGGNVARARNDNRPIFDVPTDAFDEVVRLNLHGTITPSMRFGEAMSRQRSGVILNISSMAAARAMSGALGYSDREGRHRQLHPLARRRDGAQVRRRRSRERDRARFLRRRTESRTV